MVPGSTVPIKGVHDPAAASALEDRQPGAVPADGVHEALGETLTAAPAPTQTPPSTSEPAEPEQACTAASSDEQASPPSSEPASVAAASQSREGDAAPAAEEWRPFRPDEAKAAAALLVVLRRALQAGSEVMSLTKQVLVCNTPATGILLTQMPDEGELPSLKQLEGIAPTFTKEWLGHLTQECAAAGQQPLAVFTRSAECFTHLRARHSKHTDPGKYAARLERLRAIKASLGAKGSISSRSDEIMRKWYC